MLGLNLIHASWRAPRWRRIQPNPLYSFSLFHLYRNVNTLRPRQMAPILHMTFRHAFFSKWKPSFLFKLHRMSILSVQRTTNQHWLEQWWDTYLATSHYLNQWWHGLLTHLWVVPAILNTENIIRRWYILLIEKSSYYLKGTGYLWCLTW